MPPVLPAGTKWPITGGIPSSVCSSSERSVLVRGLQKGSVQLWNTSTPSLQLICGIENQVRLFWGTGGDCPVASKSEPGMFLSCSLVNAVAPFFCSNLLVTRSSFSCRAQTHLQSQHWISVLIQGFWQWATSRARYSCPNVLAFLCRMD